MRRVATVVLGLFLTSVLLSSLVEHCVPGLDGLIGGEAVAAETHGSRYADHDASGLPDDQECVVSTDLTPGSVTPAVDVGAPKLKTFLVLWHIPSAADLRHLVTDFRRPSFDTSPRASPPYSAAFARTGRLLI